MLRLARYRTLALRRRVLLLTLGTLPGCARAPIRLDLSPARGPSIRATVGPLTVAGTVGAGGLGVGVRSGTAVSGMERRSRPPSFPSASAARVLATADRYVGTRYRYGGESPV